MRKAFFLFWIPVLCAVLLLAADQPAGKAPVGLTRIKNDRRRSMEQILVLLADSELKSYLAEVRALVS